jgi:hypothetical protein
MARSLAVVRRPVAPRGSSLLPVRLTGAGAVRGGLTISPRIIEAQRRAATGVKRYGTHASSAATMGRVDPAGYRERDANNRLKAAATQRWLQTRKG